jgi:hypothetical protein
MGVLAFENEARGQTEEPELDLAVIILLPSREGPQRNGNGNDEFDDLPEMVIGTTVFQPVIYPAMSATSTESVVSNLPEESDKEKPAEVETVEFAKSLSRRAQWKKENDQWLVEGLQ